MGWLKKDSMTAKDAAAARDRIAGDLATLRAKRTTLAERSAVAGRRLQELVAQASTAVLDDVDAKSMTALRRERQAVALEVEELELAVRTADERIAALDAEQAVAARRVLVAGALEALAGVRELAAQADCAGETFRVALEELVLAQRDAAALLAKVVPGVHEESASALARVSLWRLIPLLDVPHPYPKERVTLAEYFDRGRLRAELERELRA